MRMRFFDRPMPLDRAPRARDGRILSQTQFESLTPQELEKVLQDMPAPRTRHESDEREFMQLRARNRANRKFWEAR
jgi:hypothetical protein